MPTLHFCEVALLLRLQLHFLPGFSVKHLGVLRP